MRKYDLGDIRGKLKEATRILRPLFGLEDRLFFKIYDVSNVTDGQECPMLQIDTYHQGLKFDHSVLATAEVHNFDIGDHVGEMMYQLVNPKIHSETKALVHSQVRKRGGPACFFPHPEDPEHNSAEAHIRLGEIVTGCCGFAYSLWKEYIGESAVDMRKDLVRKMWEKIATQQDDPATDLLLNLHGEVAYSLQIAQALYKKKGHAVITELAPLSFDDARDRILGYVGVDILKPREV